MSGSAPIETPAGACAPTMAEQRARQTDALLVQRCRRGDESAWAAIVDRFSSYVYAIATRFGLSDDRAQDVHQEVFTRAFTHLASLRDDGALKPWLAQLTRRAAIDRLRSDAREFPALAAEEVPDEDPDLEQIELAMTVQRALDGLPAPFGEALRRFFIDDASYRTIGAALGVPAGTIASRISRGLSMLRGVLDSDRVQAELGGDHVQVELARAPFEG
jgi:RNA polymerase sigma factor (sigma-70 family)